MSKLDLAFDQAMNKAAGSDFQAVKVLLYWFVNLYTQTAVPSQRSSL
jgi:hypothetical protein